MSSGRGALQFESKVPSFYLQLVKKITFEINKTIDKKVVDFYLSYNLLAGKRIVEVKKRKTKKDSALFMKLVISKPFLRKYRLGSSNHNILKNYLKFCIKTI